MIRENLIFRIALTVSTTIHIGGFGLLWRNNHSFLKNGFGNIKDNIVVFQIGWIEAPMVQEKIDITDSAKGEEGETGRFLETRPIAAVPSQIGSSGYAKEDIGGLNNEYLLEVRRCIERVKFYPELAKRTMVSGSVTIGFYIDINGKPNGICIIESSGFSILDNASKEIILRASPFPKPPGSGLNQYIQTTIVFRYE